MEKWYPQLYYIKMKNSYDLGFIAIGVAMATKRHHYVFLRNRLREFVPAIIALIMGKFEQILIKF